MITKNTGSLIVLTSILTSILCGCAFRTNPTGSAQPIHTNAVAAVPLSTPSEAPKTPPEQPIIPPTPTPYVPMKVKYDWNSADGVHSDDRVKAIRSLTQSGDMNFIASEVVTLPEVIPNPVYIIANIPHQISSGVSFAKSTIAINGKSFQIGVTYTIDNIASDVITFSVSGLNTVFDSKLSQSGNLTIELFSGNQKLMTYLFSLRSPASQIEYEFINVTSVSTKLGLSNGLIAPVIEGRKSGVIQVLKVTNREPQAVDVQIPRILKSILSQPVVRKNYQDLACHGGDFRYWESTWEDQYSGELLAIPVNELLLVNLSNTLLRNQEKLNSLRIQPEESQYIALYSVSDSAWLFAGGNPLASSLAVQHVPAGCYTARENCEEGGGDHPKIICQNVTHRTFQDIPIGDARGNLRLQFSGTNPFGLRFSDFDPSQDGEVRSTNPLSGEVTVTH